MADGSDTVKVFVFTFGLVLVLQGVGCFSSHWVSSDRCGDVGLFSDCCLEHCHASYMSLEEPRSLSVPSSGLQLFSFVVFLGVCIFIIWTKSQGDAGDDDSRSFCCCCLYCCFILYFIAGIASVVGCGIVAQSDLPDDSSLGYSFYLCLFAGIYVIFQVEVLCFWRCCCRKNGNGNTSPPTTTVATTSASSQITPVQSNWADNVAEHEEVHETGGMVTARRFIITRDSTFFSKNGNGNTPPPTTTVATTSASSQITPVQSNWTDNVAEHEEVHATGGMVTVRRFKITRDSTFFSINFKLS